MRPARFELPLGLSCYRDLGPFDAATLPKGLLSEHRLKPGCWGLLTIRFGSVWFHWDDGRSGSPKLLRGGMEHVIPPEAPHHLEPNSDFELMLAFYR